MVIFLFRFNSAKLHYQKSFSHFLVTQVCQYRMDMSFSYHDNLIADNPTVLGKYSLFSKQSLLTR